MMMKKKVYSLLLGFLTILMTSCNYGERNDEEEVDILAPEDEMIQGTVTPGEDSDSLGKNSLVTRMEAEDELNRFYETFGDETPVDLEGSTGEQTVFGFSNAAFDSLSAGQKQQLSAEKSERILSLLNYYTVDEEITLSNLKERIEKNGGSYTITTVGGEPLVASLEKGEVVLQDGNQNRARIVDGDIEASNGVLHIVDRLLFPKNESLKGTTSTPDIYDDLETQNDSI